MRHYGSTAIPGMFAKPTVDILLEIPANADIDRMKVLMEAAGYICLDEPKLTMETPPPHLMFLGGYLPTGFAQRVFHIHVVFYSASVPDEIIFRDYLIAHPDTANEYAALKRTLWQDYPYDRDAYTVAKGDFLQTAHHSARK